MNKKLAWQLGTATRYSDTTLIAGYERHYVRGILDNNGTIGIVKNQCRISIITAKLNILEWLVETFALMLNIPRKAVKYNESRQEYKYLITGSLARVIAWWLYHGDIKDCCLERKRQKYLQEVADGKIFESEDEGLLYAAKAYIKNNEVHMNKPSMNTLIWCHILQKCLSFNTTPVFHNPGKRKYYLLHIPKNNKTIIDTQDTQEIA